VPGGAADNEGFISRELLEGGCEYLSTLVEGWLTLERVLLAFTALKKWLLERSWHACSAASPGLNMNTQGTANGHV
jgi:hypothetical protein